MRRIDIAAFLVDRHPRRRRLRWRHAQQRRHRRAERATRPGAPGAPLGRRRAGPRQPSNRPTRAADRGAERRRRQASPSGSPDAGAAAACTGTDENRKFFEDAAARARLDGAVRGAAEGLVRLGRQLHAEAGRQASRSRTRARNGATIALSEGAWCKDAAGCAPAGTEVGPAAFGPLAGTLFKLDDGGFAVVVAQGETASWQFQAEGIGKSKATTPRRRGRRGRGLARVRADRRLRARAVLRAVRVRRAPPAVRVRPRGHPDGRPAGDGGRRDRGAVARPAPRATRRPSAIRSCGARSRRCTRPSRPTTSSCSAAPGRRSSPSRTSTSSPATTRSSCGRPTRASTRSPARRART